MSIHTDTITLLISCPDRPGIVAAISRFIFEHQGNIVESDQHATDPAGGTFFMRISFAEDSFPLSQHELVEAFTPIADTFAMQWSVHYSRQRKRAGILVSRLDHCLVDLLWRWKSGELAMDIPFIVSNHRDLEALASMYGIPYHYFPVRREARAEDQQRMLDFIYGKAEFLILARYMQILEPFFVSAYPNRIINIHHSFLPAFVGARPYQQAFERGVKLIGAPPIMSPISLTRGRLSPRMSFTAITAIPSRIWSARGAMWSAACWPRPCACTPGTACWYMPTRRLCSSVCTVRPEDHGMPGKKEQRTA